MDQLERLCQDMAHNTNILSFSQIGTALLKGAVIGHNSGIPYGVIIGATAELSREAAKRVVAMADDLLQDLEHRPY